MLRVITETLDLMFKLIEYIIETAVYVLAGLIRGLFIDLPRLFKLF